MRLSVIFCVQSAAIALAFAAVVTLFSLSMNDAIDSSLRLRFAANGKGLHAAVHAQLDPLPAAVRTLGAHIRRDSHFGNLPNPSDRALFVPFLDLLINVMLQYPQLEYAYQSYPTARNATSMTNDKWIDLGCYQQRADPNNRSCFVPNVYPSTSIYDMKLPFPAVSRGTRSGNIDKEEYILFIKSLRNGSSAAVEGAWAPFDLFTVGRPVLLLSFVFPVRFDPEWGHATFAVSFDINVGVLTALITEARRSDDESFFMMIDPKSHTLLALSGTEHVFNGTKSSKAPISLYVACDAPQSHVAELSRWLSGGCRHPWAPSDADGYTTFATRGNALAFITIVRVGAAPFVIVERAPLDKFYRDFYAARATAIAVAVAITVLVAASALFVYRAIQPSLAALATAMAASAALQEHSRDGGGDGTAAGPGSKGRCCPLPACPCARSLCVSEVRDLEREYWALHTELQFLRPFVPRAVLVGASGGGADSSDGIRVDGDGAQQGSDDEDDMDDADGGGPRAPADSILSLPTFMAISDGSIAGAASHDRVPAPVPVPVPVPRRTDVRRRSVHGDMFTTLPRPHKLSAALGFSRCKCSVLHAALVGLGASTRSVAAVAADVEKFGLACIPSLQSRGGVVEVLTPSVVVATFNAHCPVVKHEQEACRAAASIAQHAERLGIAVTVSVASGQCVVGNCGGGVSMARMTAGSAVECAYRLAPLQQRLGCPAAATEPTVLAAPSPSFPVDQCQPLSRMSAPWVAAGLDWCSLSGAGDDSGGPSFGFGSGGEAPGGGFGLTVYALVPDRLPRRAYADAFSGFHALRQGDAVAAAGAFARMLGRQPPLSAPARHQLRRLLAVCAARDFAATGAARYAAHGRCELGWERRPGEAAPEGGLRWAQDGGEDDGGNGVDTNDGERRRGAAGDESRGAEAPAAASASGFRFSNSRDGTSGDSARKATMLRQGDGVSRTLELARKLVAPPVTVEDTSGLFSMIVDDPAPVEADAADARCDFDSGVVVDVDGRTWTLSTQRLGEGASAVVYLGLSDAGQLAAVKILRASRLVPMEDIVAEVLTLVRLRHDNIVGYVACATDNADRVAIFLEYASGGSLQDLRRRFCVVPERALVRFLRDILEGLQYLHSNGIVHCDVKPHNCLVGGDGTCRLADFGSAVNMPRAALMSHAGTTPGSPLTQTRNQSPTPSGFASVANSHNNSHCDRAIPAAAPVSASLVRGTSWFMAPEACRGELQPASDVWGLGVTVSQLCTGSLPYTWTSSETSYIVALGRGAVTLRIPPIGNEHLATFVSRCLVVDPSQRATLPELARLLTDS